MAYDKPNNYHLVQDCDLGTQTPSIGVETMHEFLEVAGRLGFSSHELSKLEQIYKGEEGRLRV